jgi:hypothetical protein
LLRRIANPGGCTTSAHHYCFFHKLSPCKPRPTSRHCGKMKNFMACLAISALLPLVIARNLAQLDVGNDFDERRHDSPSPPSVVSPTEPVTATAFDFTQLTQPAIDSSATAPFTRLTSMLKQFTWSSLCEKLSGLPDGESSQGPGPGDTWLATFALAASLGFFALWFWRRRSSRFETQQEISVHRKLFDDASNGKPNQLGQQSHLLELLTAGMRWTACASASLGIASLVLLYIDTRYIIIGCFALIALAYDRQQTQVLKEGQLRLGIDIVP